ncbi:MULTISPECIES: hypothetical protein [Amycolatopsis]|uniref:Uncharacterized protein n=1 Tax=Amycolatopsis tucumanensis TaxID=401106 RepID=A0ABP7J1K6_9PSEU|nr:hypothetical protein [Amycolatopsis tucumanensis]MCF6422230.1 hypothetical protein [Amycolatopsis tucumanensis]
MRLKKNRKASDDVVQLTALSRTGVCAGCGKRVGPRSNCCGKPACSRRIASQL